MQKRSPSLLIFRDPHVIWPKCAHFAVAPAPQRPSAPPAMIKVGAGVCRGWGEGRRNTDIFLVSTQSSELKYFVLLP